MEQNPEPDLGFISLSTTSEIELFDGAASVEPEFPNLSAYWTDVLLEDLETEETTSIGNVRWYRIQDPRSGSGVFDVLDNMDADASVVAEPLVTSLDPEIQEVLPMLGALFYVERVWLKPAYRGRGLGAVILDRLLEKDTRDEFAAAVLDPYPDDDREHPPVGAALTSARAKLGAYWGKAGFRRIGDHCWGRGFQNPFMEAAVA